METEENKNPNLFTQKLTGRSVLLFFWDMAKILILALVIIVPFRLYVAEPFVVSGRSMEPNFHNKDYLIIDRFSYHFNEPKRGEVIVLVPPKNPGDFYIKRIIGLPGETLRLVGGRVIVINKDNPQGVELKESYIPATVPTLGILGSGGQQTLGSREYLVFGDNRIASNDSRSWGVLPRENIVGKVWVSVYTNGSLKFEKFKIPSY